MSQELNKDRVTEGSVSPEGGRRPTEGETDPSNENMAPSTDVPDPEALIRPSRRQFSAKYKMEILEALDQCASSEERGSILRREGLYSSRVASWRKARRAGTLRALSQKRGRRQVKTPQEEQISLLKAENQRLQERLAEAEIINDIQKKVAALLGNRIKKPNQNGEN